MRVAPDDDVYRVNAVWLGPRGLTFPWTARYLAYATWLVTFLIVLLIEAVVPPLHVSVPPVWEISMTTLFTYAVMSFVDHERPVRAVWQTFLTDLGAPRAQGKGSPTRVQAKVRVRARPRHDRRLTRAYFAGTSHTVPTHARRYHTDHTDHTGSPVPHKPRKHGRIRGRQRPAVPQTVAVQPFRAETSDSIQPQPRTAPPGRSGGTSGKPPRTARQAPDRPAPQRQGRR